MAGGDIVLGGGNITSTNSASAITLNPNVNASYVGLTIDNDSTGATADARLVLRSGTTTEFILRCDSSNNGAEFSATVGNMQIGTATAEQVMIFTSGAVCWFFEPSGDFVPNATGGPYNIGTLTVGVGTLHLDASSAINFDNGDVTITHSANALAFAGGTVDFSAATVASSPVATTATEANSKIDVIGITIDGGGAVISTGVHGYVSVPYACTINSVTMLADVAGAAVVDIWKVAYASYPPTNANSITSGAVPTITATNIKSQDTTLTGWTTSIAAGDTLGFNVDSASTITRLHVSLKVTKS